PGAPADRPAEAGAVREDRLLALARRRPLALTAAVAVLYALPFALARLLASPSLGTDDVNENVLTQSWQWGYTARQPPLYDWLLISLQTVTGPELPSFLVIRYATLILAILAYAALARHVLRDRAWAVVAALSLTLVYQIGWLQHQVFTHTALVVLAVPVCALAALRWLERPDAGRAVALGAAIAFGFYAKHSFAAFIGTFLAAALLQAPIRARLAVRTAPLAVLAAVALYLPYALWLAFGGQSLLQQVENRLLTDETYRERVLRGLLDIPLTVLGFLSPLLPLLVVFFPRAFSPKFARAASGEPDFARLFRDQALFALALMVVGLLFFGVGVFKESHMQALFLLAPLWLFARVEASAPSARRVRLFVRLVAAAALFTFAVKIGAFVWKDRPFCTPICRDIKPYDRLAEALAQRGAATGTLIGGDEYVAGNLRRLFPEARVLGLRMSYFRPPADPARQQVCLLVYDSGPDGSRPPPLDRMASEFGPAAPAEGSAVVAIDEPWSRPFGPAGWRTSHWGIVALDPAGEACR
ncbi:glycosyltransferase family 39 protein, partial [Propylenella binzhouense]